MNENTRKILADLKAAGLDTSAIENQITVNPILDKKADQIIGGGVLRQQEYTRYMNEAVRQKQEVEKTAKELATLHDAAKTTQLPQQTLDAIDKMEKALIDTGLFDEESIKAVSYQGRVPLQTIINDSKKAIDDTVKLNVEKENENRFEMPTNKFDESKFIDTDTFQTSLANVAYGGIATNLRINAAIEEAKELGIKLDRQAISKLEQNLRTGMESGKNLDIILDETFEISKARQAKQEQDVENRIKTAREEARAEALKEAGIPVTKKFNYGRHPILDRKSQQQVQPNGNVEGKAPENKELPTNKYGDVEVFRGRRGREERLQSASELHEKVMEHYANDPTFVE